MYHPVRKKMFKIITSAIILVIITHPCNIKSKSIKTTTTSADTNNIGENFDDNLIDFDEDLSVKFNKNYGTVPWHGSNNLNKERHRYTIVNDSDKYIKSNVNEEKYSEKQTKYNKNIKEETTTQDYSVIPLELISTTENVLISIIESTTEPDLTVIPLTSTVSVPKIEIKQSVTLPASTETISTTDTTTDPTEKIKESKLTVIPLSTIPTTKTNEAAEITTNVITTENIDEITTTTTPYDEITTYEQTSTTFEVDSDFTTFKPETLKTDSEFHNHNISIRDYSKNLTDVLSNSTSSEIQYSNTSKNVSRSDVDSSELDPDVPIYTELDTEEQPDVPEDYYDSKDVLPTTAPKTDALSVIFGLAGSVVESVVGTVAERVVPKTIFDLFKRMQRQNEMLEAEKLRSPEENGGLGQFTRGIIKSISSGISKPLSQLMAGVRDIGSLDTDRGFVSSLASGVSSVANVANSVVDTFKDRVQAIYPGTVWCGDGRSAAARSSDLGLFFFTDTCCRQHDACKLYILAGETKYGLTNTGLFTRSHCSCDAKFRECLQRTSSLVSAQIGLTYFNVLGPQCFRRAHPILRCVRRTRITGQKCEEYELDYTKPRMWQWFDNETF